MKKKLLVLVVIIVSLIAIGAVASQENVSEDLGAPDSNEDVVKQPDSTSSDVSRNTVKAPSDQPQEYISISITKIWNDEQNNSTRPNGIDVVILGNGEKVTEAYITNKYAVADNAWVYTFENLPKYDDNHNLIQYDVQELNVGFYNSQIMKNSNYEFMIINTFAFPPQPDNPDDNPDINDDTDDTDDSDDSENNSSPVKNDTKKDGTKKVTTHTKNKHVNTTKVNRETGNPVVALILVVIIAVFVPLRRK